MRGGERRGEEGRSGEDDREAEAALMEETGEDRSRQKQRGGRRSREYDGGEAKEI